MPANDADSSGAERSDFEIRDCPLCERSNREARPLEFSQPPWLIKRCDECSLVYLENTLPYDQLVTGDHAWTVSKVSERARRRAAEPVFDRVSRAWRRGRRWLVPKRDRSVTLIRAFIPSGTLLDVGCGSTGLKRYLAPGLKVSGIEIDKAAADQADEIAREQGGRVVHADAVNGFRLFDADSFDGVLMRSFLEHEVNPRGALLGAVHALRPGGCLIIKVPNFASVNRKVRGGRWCGFRFPDHVNYFEPQTLTRLVNECGLEVDRFGLMDRLPSSDNMWMVARKRTALRSAA